MTRNLNTSLENTQIYYKANLNLQRAICFEERAHLLAHIQATQPSLVAVYENRTVAFSHSTDMC